MALQWLDTDPENCPIAHTLELVGEKWSLLIVRDAANGVRRFDDFRRHVGLSDAVLADRLRKLVGHGVLATRPYQDAGRRTRLEYLLTPKGWDLWPVLLTLKQFGEKYAGDPRGPMMVVRHRDCDAPIRVVAECAAGHGGLTSRDAVAAPGPGARTMAEREGAGERR